MFFDLKIKFISIQFNSDIAHDASKEFLDIEAILVCRFTVKRMRDMIKNIVKCTVRIVLTAHLNHLARLAKWLSVHLQCKWLCVRIRLVSINEINDQTLVQL